MADRDPEKEEDERREGIVLAFLCGLLVLALLITAGSSLVGWMVERIFEWLNGRT